MTRNSGSLNPSFMASPVLAGALFLLVLMLLAAPSALARNLPDFTQLVEQNSAAVVNISTTQEVAARGSSRGLPFDERQLEQLPDIFQEFFRGPSPFGRSPQPRQPRRSMGSGFIVSEDGYVLTNNHVIDGADEIIVRLSDRRELPATLVGTDPRTDMAVLKIEDDEPLPVVSVGRSATLKPGEWVLAIGSPFGFDYTVTAGIVSAVGRSLPTENYVPFIQTDVAINPGNSGGPLFNLDGEVVGINSQIYTRSGGFMGVSFAIPIDDAMNVFRQLRDDGRVSRGWLGVLIQEVNRDLAESFGLSRPRGALIAEVMPDSPAQAGGLRSGDIVLSYNREPIELSSDLPPKVGRTPVGEKARLQVLREGREVTLDVEIGRLPEGDGDVAAEQPAPAPAAGPLGMQVEPVPQDMADSLAISGGVIVTEVGQGAAFQAGLRRNDIITELNREPVTTVEDFRRIVGELPSNRAVPVRVIRDGRASYLVIKP